MPHSACHFGAAAACPAVFPGRRALGKVTRQGQAQAHQQRQQQVAGRQAVMLEQPRQNAQADCPNHQLAHDP